MRIESYTVEGAVNRQNSKESVHLFIVVFCYRCPSSSGDRDVESSAHHSIPVTGSLLFTSPPVGLRSKKIKISKI